MSDLRNSAGASSAFHMTDYELMCLSVQEIAAFFIQFRGKAILSGWFLSFASGIGGISPIMFGIIRFSCFKRTCVVP